LKTLPVRVTLPELIAKFKDRPLQFKPGAKFSYSNSGYVVLGRIIEAASGQNYPSYLKQAILDPLKMTDTGFDSATPILKHRASGYTRRLGIVLTNCDYIDMSIPHAAGAMYSTTGDLLKWDQALYTEALLPGRAITAMFTPFKDHYGYGWVIDEQFGLKRIHHGGGIMGFVTQIARYPEEKLLVVVLSNLENAPVGPISRDLAAMARGMRYVIPREPKMAKLGEGLLDRYVGKYAVQKTEALQAKSKEMLEQHKQQNEIKIENKLTINNKNTSEEKSETIEVTRDGSKLFYERSGAGRMLLVPESETLFYVPAGDTEIRFELDASSRVTHVVYIADGREAKAAKASGHP
jgi:hypothetical protein